MYTITKEFAFSASHQLNHLPTTHPCSRVHGHNYVIKVELRSTKLNKNDFVRDYRELDGLKIYLDDVLDHRHLNEIMLLPPTAENIAKYLFDMFITPIPELYAVEVSETPKTNCRYERS